MFQTSKEALIRDPGNRMYNGPVPVSETAKDLWEYAVLSENVYIGQWKQQTDEPPVQPFQMLKLPEAAPDAYSRACRPGSTEPLPLPGWKMWEKFPSDDTIKEALRVGLYIEAWEKVSTPPVVAVVFRGTEFTSLRDWISNLRWFLRFVPFYRDQYTVVSERVGDELVKELAKRKTDLDSVRVTTAGHSLGGGLAQHLAYALPLMKSEDGALLPRVLAVYAFDPSPVTGFYSVDRDVRTVNAQGLKIDRSFEHGEILAYVRLLLSYLYPPPAANPSVREIRYNFVASANPLRSHSMRMLACALANAAGQADVPDLFQRFRAQK